MGWPRRFAPCAVALGVAGCASAPGSAPPQPASARQPALQPMPVALRNPGFENEPYRGQACSPPGWDCIPHAGTDSFRFFDDETAPAQGKRSLCIETLTREPWAIASHGCLRHGADARQSCASRSRCGLTRSPATAPDRFASAQSGSGAVIARASHLLSGTQGRQRVEVELDVPPGAALIEVGVSIVGRGRVFLDDARLEILGSPKSPV